MTKRIVIVANPAAGQDIPILGIMNRVLQASDYEWDLVLTKKAGDAFALTRKALEEKADIVAAYGGDGTVREVASAMVGSETPLAILPGGTANVMSVDLGIPADFAQACELAISPDHEIRSVDVGRTGEDGYFILRIGTGLEAEMVEGADRSLKDRIGSLAYALSALQALQNPPLSRYRIELDTETVEVEGLTCLICNSGSVGQGNLRLSPNTSVSDGLLDVFVLQNAALGSLVDVIRGVLTGNTDNVQTLQHWQGKSVKVEADPPQSVQADGETIDPTPVTATIIPGALRVIVPKAQ